MESTSRSGNPFNSFGTINTHPHSTDSQSDHEEVPIEEDSEGQGSNDASTSSSSSDSPTEIVLPCSLLSTFLRFRGTAPPVEPSRISLKGEEEDSDDTHLPEDGRDDSLSVTSDDETPPPWVRSLEDAGRRSGLVIGPGMDERDINIQLESNIANWWRLTGWPLAFNKAQEGDLRTLKQLFAHGAKTYIGTLERNLTDKPLHAAARRGHLKVVEYLIEQGLDVHARDSRWRKPLFEAFRCGKINVVPALIKADSSKRPLQTRDTSGTTPMHMAAMRFDPKGLQYFIDSNEMSMFTWADKNGFTPLAYAYLQLLTERGLLPKEYEQFGLQPLPDPSAKERAYAAIAKLLEMGHTETAKTAKAFRTWGNECLQGQVDQAKSNTTRIAAHDSRTSEQDMRRLVAKLDDVDTLELLLDNKVEVDRAIPHCTFPFTYTPLVCAIVNRSQKVTKRLAQEVDVNQPVSGPYWLKGIPSEEIVKWLGKYQACPPIQWAILSDNPQAIQSLVQAKADLNARSRMVSHEDGSVTGDGGPTPLMLACKAVRGGDTGKLSPKKVLSLLYDNVPDGTSPADLNAVDAEGRTALHWAILEENLPMAEELFARGAKLDTKTTAGLTPTQSLHQLMIEKSGDTRPGEVKIITDTGYSYLDSTEELCPPSTNTDVWGRWQALLINMIARRYKEVFGEGGENTVNLMGRVLQQKGMTLIQSVLNLFKFTIEKSAAYSQEALQELFQEHASEFRGWFPRFEGRWPSGDHKITLTNLRPKYLSLEEEPMAPEQT